MKIIEKFSLIVSKDREPVILVADFYENCLGE